MLLVVEKVLEEMQEELGVEKAEGIKQNIKRIQRILEQDK